VDRRVVLLVPQKEVAGVAERKRYDRPQGLSVVGAVVAVPAEL
jgi:hypothetical protein